MESNRGEKKWHSPAVKHKLLPVTLQEFLFLSLHDRIINCEKKESERKQQPIALSCNEHSERHEEGTQIKRIPG